MEPKMCALYLRLSDDKKKTGENVADQERACREIAEAMQFVVFDVYCDNSRPASDPEAKPRPEFERLLRDADAGLFSAVIVRHADRLYRHPIDQLRVSRVFGTRKILVHQEWAGYPLDLATPSGVLNAGIAAQVALYEIEHKKERQKVFHEQLLREGRPQPGGPRPFGFNRDMTPHDLEAPEIGLAVQHVLAGGSLGSLISDWNNREIPAPRGGKWGYSSMRALLMRWSNAGIRQRTVIDSVTGRRTAIEHSPGTWEGLVNEEDFRALRIKLEDPSRIRHRGQVGRRHLLSHILRCGKCGGSMRGASTTSRAGRKYLTYQCGAAGCRLGVDYETANFVITEALYSRLTLPSASMLELTAGERDKAQRVKARLEQIVGDERLIETSKISPESRLRQLEGLYIERRQLEDRLSGITQRMALAAMLANQVNIVRDGKASFKLAAEVKDQVRHGFASLDLNSKREIIRALFRIEVQPALKGVRPTKSTAAARVIVTWIDPITGAPEPPDWSDCEWMN
ncbi:recombinase family protein [Nocardioides sp. CN2-186]|uniref:recombinase family protein n=1 Tax=Nocardioides tweenelious TaxID=3156607 RepID=UPI0032B581BF